MTRPPVLLAALAMLLSACSVTARSAPPQSPGASAQTDTSDIEIEGGEQAPPSSEVTAMVQRVLPSVVNVRVGGGEGSGVIIDRRGILVTNNHVVQGATDVTVVFPESGRRLKGTVVGTAVENDLAVVKVDDQDLEPIEIGASLELLPGDPVVAIGFPLGLGITVTQGIVSATTRTIEVPNAQGGSSTFEGLLQTDAAINPGNSGGALVDLNGRLVGINSAAAQAGAAENIGFAIAMDRVLPTINQILSGQRPWIGVYLQTVDPNLAGQLGLPADTEGAAVLKVVRGGPAGDAGLEAGDIITGIGGTAVASDLELIKVIARRKPGDNVSLEVLGSSGPRSVMVRLERRPPSFQ
ncbi:MAG TPA: trypsin-like peptidase domain-containing protein [Actinomycetota bacterium]|nr:trypsin-like peptidase domain-containing protein [Actinomycetota bacterium]